MEYYSNNDYRSYLAHHGIKGMHWGVRRFQPYGKGGYTPKNPQKVSSGRNKKSGETSKIGNMRSGETWKVGNTTLSFGETPYEKNIYDLI